MLHVVHLRTNGTEEERMWRPLMLEGMTGVSNLDGIKDPAKEYLGAIGQLEGGRFNWIGGSLKKAKGLKLDRNPVREYQGGEFYVGDDGGLKAMIKAIVDGKGGSVETRRTASSTLCYSLKKVWHQQLNEIGELIKFLKENKKNDSDLWINHLCEYNFSIIYGIMWGEGEVVNLKHSDTSASASLDAFNTLTAMVSGHSKSNRGEKVKGIIVLGINVLRCRYRFGGVGSATIKIHSASSTKHEDGEDGQVRVPCIEYDEDEDEVVEEQEAEEEEEEDEEEDN